MTVPTRGWSPLPECSSCRRPTRRAAWVEGGGVCSDCRQRDVADPEAVDQLREWQDVAARRGRAEREEAAARAARRRRR